MLLLDSHVLIWNRTDDSKLGRRARDIIGRALEQRDVCVSAITFWEIAILHDKGRLAMMIDVPAWRASLLQSGLTEIPVDGEIAARAGTLAGLPGDPADRIIVSTALAGHQLVTADEQILQWSANLPTLDARE